jgi:hypothetical protein
MPAGSVAKSCHDCVDRAQCWAERRTRDRFAIRTTLDTFREKEAIILAISLMLAMTVS